RHRARRAVRGPRRAQAAAAGNPGSTDRGRLETLRRVVVVIDGINIAAARPQAGLGVGMRIKILHIPRGACIDGLQLDRFAPGHLYEVGHLVAAYLFAEGWAEPVAPD